MVLNLRDRFLAKIRVNKVTGCWEWTASKQPSGYGQIRSEGTTKYAHRVAYELFVGPIPEGYEIDHVCRNRGCVNPDPKHLEAVPHRINWERGNSPSAIFHKHSHCRHGHEYTTENTKYNKKTGLRECRQCRRNAMNNFWRLNPAYKKQWKEARQMANPGNAVPDNVE
jgi:hypothetical protein